jgi:hypothetical protein
LGHADDCQAGVGEYGVEHFGVVGAEVQQQDEELALVQDVVVGGSVVGGKQGGAGSPSVVIAVGVARDARAGVHTWVQGCSRW